MTSTTTSTTAAQAAAAAILEAYGSPRSDESLRAMLALAYAQGSREGFIAGTAAAVAAMGA